MQAKHHLRKAKARALDGDARLAGQCHFEATAKAETVDHRDGRNFETFEAVDHRMGTADGDLDRPRIAGAAEFVDVGAGNEAGWFCRADDEAGGACAFQRRQHRLEFFQQIGRQRVGAGTFAVEQQPGDAVGIAGQLEMAVGTVRLGLRTQFEHAVAEKVHDLRVHDHTVSISMAPPCPPPMHSVAMPRLVPSRFIALTRCSTMRLPLQPTG
jgi:hypothetical protein